MKRISTALISVLIVLSVFSTSFASMSYSPSADSDALLFSGDGIADDYVILELIKADLIDAAVASSAQEIAAEFKSRVALGHVSVTGLIQYWEQAEVQSDGTWTHTVPMPSGAKGRYVALNSKGEVTEVLYAPVSEKYKIITDTQALAPVLKKPHISSNMVYMTSCYEIYKTLTGKADVVSMTTDRVNSIPTVSSPTQEQKITAVGKMADISNTAVVITALNEGSALVGIDHILAVSSDPALKKTDMTSGGHTAVVNALSSKAYSDFAAFISDREKQIALNEFNYTNKATDAPALMATMNTMLQKLNLDVSTTGYMSLGDSLKAQAAEQMYNLKCTDLSSFVSNLQTVTSGIIVSNGYVPPQNGGSGGFGGGVLTPPGDNTVKEEYETRQNAPFTDLDGYEWARTAIDKLYSMRVIAGYADNTFKPGNNITRAEFLKLLMEMFYQGELSEDSSVFADVAHDAWHRSYVMTAYKYGIAEGDGVNFRPDDLITRQEAAVLIYRAADMFGLLNTEGQGGFADEENISDYAKNPINILKAHGIVSGDQNGFFNPLMFASRAEAAQMLYNVLSLI